jgi:4-amino-4-deoxy-L-arabinose transferase-like glycosyltransferase
MAGAGAILREGIEAHRLLGEVAIVGVAVAILLVSVVPNLADHPVPTDDEVWVMSAAYKLAEEGVFGSDMFAGFFHADERYFFNMPLHHFAVAASFKLFGAGILEARLVGVLYGVATLVLSYLLARRVYGIAAGGLTLALLLFLRLNMGFDTGLPLQELSSNMRYDLAPVPFLLTAVLILLGGATLLRVALVGLLIGIATLLQFYGVFLLPVAVAFLWLEALPRQERMKLIGALVGAAALVGLPYGVYILSDYEDFAGQAGTIDRRADFTDPAFYVDNLIDEGDRFARPLAIPFAFSEVPAGQDPFLTQPQQVPALEALLRRPSAKAGVLLGLPIALAFFGWRALKQDSRADRLLLLCLGGLVVQYALLESAKFYIYWVPVVPFLCIGIAAASLWLLRQWRRDALGSLLAAGTAAVLLFFLLEGSAARLNGLRTAQDAPGHADLASSIREHVPTGSRVIGATSLWWGLRDSDYRSYFLFFYLTRPDAGEHKRTLPEFVDEFDAEYIVLTRVASNELEKNLSSRDLADWRAVLEGATRVTRLEGGVARPYGYVDIWRLD